MTNSTVEPFVPAQAADTAALLGQDSDAGWSVRTASVTAGVGILLMAALAGFGNFVAVQGLVTDGNAGRTAEDIMGSEGLFRLGILSLFVVVALDVVVAWSLYRVFSPVSRALSMLAACFRVAYAGVFLVAVSQLIGVLHLLGNDAYLRVFSAGQLNAQALSGIASFKDVWAAGLVLFGLHLLVIGYLAYRSGYVPRVLGILLAVAGLGYVIDSFGAVMSGGSWNDISSFTFIGEFLFGVWLVIRGWRLVPSQESRHVS